MLHLGLNEREIERVLAGHQPHGRPDLAEVAYLFARLRTLRDFEQAPPMSPKLLAELDASEVERRDDELARERVRRNRVMRRRWRLVGAAAVLTMLGGLFFLEARSQQNPQSEIDVRSPNTSGATDDEPVASTTVPDTQPPQTTTTTAPPQTTAPPATEPPETTAAPADPPDSADGPPNVYPGPRSDGPGAGPYGGENGNDPDWEDDEWRQFQEYCERNPHDEMCRWWDDYWDYMNGQGPPP